MTYYFQQNGLAERKKKDQSQKGLEVSLVEQKYLNIQNKYPKKALHWMTPKEAFSGHKPNLLYLCVFGCVAYCYILLIYRNKLDSKALSI